ncbi:MAG: toll/interleukin-1 receptor domain-containing protein, partial [Chloroflexi bacterium]|nr:toll/interleukin-1 receptor domain-containing protein [Chloroflexota bacterium]
MTHKKQLVQLKEKINTHFDAAEFRELVFDLGIDFDNIPGNAKNARIIELLDRLNDNGRIPELITLCQNHRPKLVWTYQARLFIAYKRHAQQDADLATYLHDSLQDLGHTVFIDQDMRTGEAWMERIDAEIKASDYLILLLSEESIDSEMVRSEINRAKEYQKVQGRPQLLPVRVAFEGMLPYAIAGFLNPKQYVLWQSPTDNDKVVQAILQAIDETLLEKPDPFSQIPETAALSEDGRYLTQTQTSTPPSPEFDPRFIKQLTAPGGAVRFSDKLYVEREEDGYLRDEIVQWGATITIRAPRQTGKTSLLMRGLHHAKKSGAEVVFIDGQSLGLDEQTEIDPFLRGLAETLCDELGIDVAQVDRVWNGRLGSQKKLTNLIEDHILPQFDVPIVLALDEADALLTTSFSQHFFGLLRSWHNRRAMSPEWEKLNIALVISTEPYLLIDDINQSPFNVGLKLDLSDFTSSQFSQLNVQHGTPLDETAVSKAFSLLDGQPYLTRKLFYLTAVKQQPWPQIATQATLDNGPFGDHLRRLNWSIRTQPKLQQALLQIIRTQTCGDED